MRVSKDNFEYVQSIFVLGNTVVIMVIVIVIKMMVMMMMLTGLAAEVSTFIEMFESCRVPSRACFVIH